MNKIQKTWKLEAIALVSGGLYVNCSGAVGECRYCYKAGIKKEGMRAHEVSCFKSLRKVLSLEGSGK